MSEFRIDQIKSQDATKGPEIAGITTFTGTSGLVMPSGPTEARYTNGAISDSLIFYFDPTYDDCYAQPKAGGTQPVKDLTGYHPNGTPASANTTYNHEFRALNLSGGSGESDIQFNAVDNSALSPNDVTVETWFRMDGDGFNNYHVAFQKNGGFSGGGVFGNRVVNESSGSYAWFTICVSTNRQGQRTAHTPNFVMEQNKWYQMVGTYEAKPEGLQYSRSRLYLNGVQQLISSRHENGVSIGNPGNLSKDLIWTPGTVLNYGAGYTAEEGPLAPLVGANQYHIGDGDGRQFNGDVAIVRVYGRALSAEEININFQTDRGRFEI